MPQSRALTASTIFALSSALLFAAGCGPTGEAGDDTAGATDSLPPEVEIVARDYAFEAPDSVPSGWTTVRLANEGAEEHFMYLYRLPDDKTFEQFVEEFGMPFGAVWHDYATGEISRTEAEARFAAEIPGWFFTDVVSTGGTALTEPGQTAVSTVRLTPGNYVMECYVKTPDGRWHTELGMQRMLVVTAEETGAAPPPADVVLSLSSYEITASEPLRSGPQIVEVRATDRPEGFMAHDVNLFRLDGTNVEQIVSWMDWMDMDQFRAPAPGVSLGGMEHLSEGGIGYLHLDLEPGSYAWVSEGYGARGMTSTFEVE